MILWSDMIPWSYIVSTVVDALAELVHVLEDLLRGRLARLDIARADGD